MAENDRKSTATTVEREAKLVYEEGESASSGIAEAFQLTECERSEVLNSQFRMTLVLRHTHTHTLFFHQNVGTGRRISVYKSHTLPGITFH